MKNGFPGLLVLLACMIGGAAAAQNVSTSPYSIYGLGLLYDNSSALNRGLGGTGIGVRDSYFPNHANPASYTGIASSITHMYEIGFYVEGNRFSTTSATASQSAGGLTSLNYWFRFSRRWASTFGLTPFSSVSYNVASQQELGTATSADYQYEGSGNISRLYWGNGFAITKRLSVGLNTSFLFGSINKQEMLAANASQNGLLFENKITVRKFNFDAGVQYEVPFNKSKLVVGATVDNGFKAKGTQDYTLVDTSYDTLETNTGAPVYYSYPTSYGVGLSFQSKRSTVAGDLKFSQWSQGNYNDQRVGYRDTWRVSLGYNYLGKETADSYWGYVGLRAGVYYQDYYLMLKNETFGNYGFSLGLVLPVLDNKSSINLNYNYDYLGTRANGLVVQQSQRISLELIVRDLWGVRRKFD